MHPEDRTKIFNDYFNSIFKDSNVLTPEQFEKTADSYEAKFGEFIPQDKNSRILDIGCGCGHFLYYLQKNGYTNFYGIDVSSQQVDY
ncbi:class I SAM-dependent methyltransferase, partial [Patescibacteria group bacterium]|nr:class I SAM-dependent methyltransferase [Patescibacteria group bacterium]